MHKRYARPTKLFNIENKQKVVNIMKKAILASVVITILSACGKPAVKIESYNRINQIFGIKYVEVKVTSIADEVVVKNIVVNRGNCKIENINYIRGGAKIPKKLKFGESVSVTFSGPCTAAQVDVVTDKGDWTMTY
jgi:hypothetical protein